MPQVKKQDAIDILRRLKARAARFEIEDFEEPAFDKWRRDVRIAIIHIFGEKSQNANDFDLIDYISDEEMTRKQWANFFEGEIEIARSLIQSMIDEIRQFWPDESSVKIEVEQPHEQHTKATKRVFIVHGHDDSMKEPVARVLAQLGLEPVILHEQPNKGRTIIEKFTDYSDVSFAVVLLSPDDWGYAKGTSNSQAKLRARQNVVLELGYFLAKLGRQRVFPLYKNDPNFEMPSDYSGVAYTQFDNSGAWKMRLVKELRSCGFSVDANRVI